MFTRILTLYWLDITRCLLGGSQKSPLVKNHFVESFLIFTTDLLFASAHLLTYFLFLCDSELVYDKW